MIPYQTKQPVIHGTRYESIRREALQIFSIVEKKTKRQPYIRSAYFKKQKVFLKLFWSHLFQKNPRDRVRRLRYLRAALDVIQYTKAEPFSQQNPHKKGELLYRFAGLTKEGELFYVQIKENKRTGHKYFMSCFPAT